MRDYIDITECSAEFDEFAGRMKESFGFDWNQSRYFQHMSIQDFNKKAREEMRSKRDRLIEEKEMYEKDLNLDEKM